MSKYVEGCNCDLRADAASQRNGTQWFRKTCQMSLTAHTSFIINSMITQTFQESMSTCRAPRGIHHNMRISCRADSLGLRLSCACRIKLSVRGMRVSQSLHSNV